MTQENAETLTRLLGLQSCIIFSEASGWLTPIGSGTIVVVSNKFFVCTASHVIRQSNQSQLKIGSQLLDHDFFSIKSLKTLGGGDEEKEDLAWIEIEPPSGITLNNVADDSKFYSGPVVSQDDYVISGFPSALVKERKTEDVNLTNLQHFAYITGTTNDVSWGNEYDNDYHIVLEYLKQMYKVGGETTHAPTAWGISGGGIWFIDRERKMLRLAGVQTGWDGPNERIYGIKISAWLTFLKSTYPNL